MLKVKEFVELTILEIQKGTEEFNSDNMYKALMPSHIEFSLAVDSEGFVSQSQDASRLNFVVQLAHYPWLKKD